MESIRIRRSRTVPAWLTSVLAIAATLLAAPPAQAVVSTYQEGVATYTGTQDTYVDALTPDTSFGNATVVLLDLNSPGEEQQGLLRFDNIFGAAPGQIPFGSVISSATLTVNVVNPSLAGVQIRLHRMLAGWSEAATWNSMTAGIQRNDIEAMSAFDAQVADPTGSGPQTITGLAAALQAWADGAANLGWALIINNSDGWDFSSSENAIVALRPLLTVTWSTDVCPAGVVTTTADLGPGSLRACINYANGNPGTTISFNIPGPGNRSAGADSWWGISPLIPLPTITAAGTVIDGATQTANQGNTNSRGPEIELDGALAGAANGLVIGGTGDGSTIRGLVLQNFENNGILLQGGNSTVAGNYVGIAADGTTPAANNTSDTIGHGGIRVESANNVIGGPTVADRNILSANLFAGLALNGAGASDNQVLGNYIGVDAGGTLDRGNTQEGIDIEYASSNFIGGTAAGARNILSGNGSDGIEIDAGDANVVQGNYIGTDFTGALVIPNDRDGIDINEEAGDGATGNLIGGTGANEGNLIRGNTLYGVQARDATVVDNAILGNRIYGNGTLDIDVNDDGITVNDPLDADTGSNDLLNYPVIVAAAEDAGTITAYFALDVPAGDYRIEFFSNPSGAHGSGNGGGEVFAGARTITHGGGGVEYFSHSFAGLAGDVVTATATEQLGGPAYASTSEFSTAFAATAFTPFSARWPLDETAGVTAVDADSGNDGTYTNGVLLNQPGACTNTGNAVHFDGIDDYVEVPHSPDYLLNEGTVAMWINIDAIGAEQMFFSKDRLNLLTGGHLTLSVQPGGNLQTRLQSTTASMFVNSAPVAAGTWIHVAFSWGPAGMAMYVDGALPITNPYTGGLGVTSGGAGNFEPIAFGASTVVSGAGVVTPLEHFFTGFMDDVRIYNRALSYPEIQTLAACTPSLDIVKRAFWSDGTPIPSGATIPSGIEFKYLLYVNNRGPARNDLSVRDVLDAAFQYQAGTIQVDNSVAGCAAALCTGPEEQAIFAAVEGTAFLSDAADGDVASYTGGSSSVDAGNGNVANAQLDINADAVWSVLFSVKMP